MSAVRLILKRNASAPRRAGRLLAFCLLFAQLSGVCVAQFTNILEFPITESLPALPANLTYVQGSGYWFNVYYNGAIGQIDLVSNVISETALLTSGGAFEASAYPFGMVLGPDTNLWITESGMGQLGRINPVNTNITQFPLSNSVAQPWTLIVGPDNRLWFIEFALSKIAAVDIHNLTNADGTLKITEFGPFGTNTLNGAPGKNAAMNGLTKGPDGKIWFTQGPLGAVGNLSTDGTVTNILQLPNPLCEPEYIAAGADGNMWFTEYLASKIGRVSTTLDPASLVEFSLPVLTGYSAAQPYQIILGPDGNMWFTEYTGGAVGRIVVNGTNAVITLFATPTPFSFPNFLATGDPNIWFGEFSSGGTALTDDHIGKIIVSEALSLTNVSATINGVTANFSNSDQTNTVTVAWGDGSTDTVTVTNFAAVASVPPTAIIVTGTGTNLNGGTFNISGTHTYASAGPFSVTVTVTDSFNNLATTTVQTGVQPVILPAMLHARLVANNLVLNWQGTNFSLMTSTNQGSWTNINGATSPYTNSLGGTRRFFKLKSK